MLESQRSVATLLACVAVGLVGCQGTETGNPPSASVVSVTMVLSEPDSVALPYASIEGAWLTTESVELLGCVGHDTARFPGHTWNLLQPSPQTAETSIPAFCGVSAQLGTTTPEASVPGELVGASAWVRLLRFDGTPLELTSTDPLTFDATADGAIDGPALSFSLDPSGWFAAVQLDALEPESDGVVRVSSTSNESVLQSVESRFADGARLEVEDDDEFDDD